MPVRSAIAALILLAAAPAGADVEPTYGASIGWQYRRDFGGASRPAFAPELWGGAYLDGPRERLFWRPALRLGYVGLVQAEMPGSIQIEERDVVASAELGAVYDGVVIPSLAIGGGPVVRFIDFSTDGPVRSEGDPVSNTELMARIYLQLGVGLPLLGGKLVIEPSARVQQIFGDDRVRLRVAVDGSVSF